jgi:NTE family protein
MSSSMRRALVLGAGGHAAIAWETGVIAGLADRGIDVRKADLLIGTSAGSTVAAQITSSLVLEDLFQRQVDPRLQTDEVAPQLSLKQWREEILLAKAGAGGAIGFLRRVGSIAVSATTVSVLERRRTIAARLPEHAWPGQQLEVIAVDADTGDRRVFDKTTGVPLVDAVAASGAVAGIFPPVIIGGRRYIDGGFYSIDNADLAVGCDRILIVTLRSRVPPMCAFPLDGALQTLRESGAHIEVVHPDEASEEAFNSVGGNILDPAVREPAARAGREQGRCIASRQVLPLWQ